jgi:signal recognition particle subunit SRP19
MSPKGDDHFVLWPSYFDASLTRRQGRRVSEALAVKAPDAPWIEVAAKRVHLEPELDEKAKMSRDPYAKAGCVFVARKGSKEQVVEKVAREMRESQDRREKEE